MSKEKKVRGSRFVSTENTFVVSEPTDEQKELIKKALKEEEEK